MIPTRSSSEAVAHKTHETLSRTVNKTVHIRDIARCPSDRAVLISLQQAPHAVRRVALTGYRAAISPEGLQCGSDPPGATRALLRNTLFARRRFCLGKINWVGSSGG
ncbi:MAG TPA: hypothetical protein EYO34_08100 [Candidatus Marinimicrobia bacterium]|nr:hypothetical protein [Candidatus Neomarinimicrobiota bacterium]